MIIIISFLAVFLFFLVLKYVFYSKSESIYEDEEFTKLFPLDAFKRKPFIFDNVSEFHFFKTLEEIVGDKYRVIPQVHYSHLITETSLDKFERRKYRSMIDRKAADFVICDRETVVPKLVIELDGSYHSLPISKKRDNFINAVLEYIKLPILHVDIRDMEDKDGIRDRITKALDLNK